MASVHMRLGHQILIAFLLLLPAAHALSGIVNVTAINEGGIAGANVPMTFGQVFIDGNVVQGNSLELSINSVAIPAQINIMATNPDNSVRHAIITAILPNFPVNASIPIKLTSVSASSDPSALNSANITLNNLLSAGYDANIVIVTNTTTYTLDAKNLIQNAISNESVNSSYCEPYAKNCNAWLSGPIMSEWILGGPVIAANGTSSPHLAVYFDIAAYGPAPLNHVMTDVIIENDWAYMHSIQDIKYNATIYVTGNDVYSINSLKQYAFTRWHYVTWWPSNPGAYAKLNSSYLQATNAVPLYENIPISNSTLSKVRQYCAPMQHCDQTIAMGTTGAQPAIGPLPQWTTAYVISTSYNALKWMEADDDALGAYPVFYRSNGTGGIISIVQDPCTTSLLPASVPNCKYSPHGNQTLPRCYSTLNCSDPYVPNVYHHPSPGYVSYMVTGSWYYLDQMTFWSNWIVLSQNPAYRNYSAGILPSLAPRGQAWSMRTFGDDSFILPNKDPYKSYFTNITNNNINWYLTNYVTQINSSSNYNNLGLLTNGESLNYIYNGNYSGIATWQAAFITWSISNLVDLGFSNAKPFSQYLAKFEVNSVIAPSFCWNVASAYTLQVQTRSNSTPANDIYKTMKQVYDVNFPKMQGIPCSSFQLAQAQSVGSSYKYGPAEMTGYPYSSTGFPANFQIGIAGAAESGISNAVTAWRIFENRKDHAVDYYSSPQFAVVPRGVYNDTPRLHLFVAASPFTQPLKSGEYVHIDWVTQNVNSCSASWISNSSYTGAKLVTLTSTTAYPMTCTGPSGQVTKSVTVYVK